MRRFLASRPSPAMAVAFVALLAALSGTAIALPGTNSVDSGDIKNGQVKGKDVGRNAVTGKKVKNRSLTGADVRDNSLTGADINESTLGQVPSANTANSANSANTATSANSANTANTAANANAVNGNSMRAVNFAVDAPVGDTVVLDNFNGLTLTASCAAGPTLSVKATTSVDGAQLQSHSAATFVGGGGEEITNDVNDDDFLTTDGPRELLPNTAPLQGGQTDLLQPNGEHVTVVWRADEFSSEGPQCEFNGFAIGS
jgi:hypothetical protein